MRYINLTDQERLSLEQGFKNHCKHHFRQRCQALLLSDRAIEVKVIAGIIQTRTRTIYSWMNRWNVMGIAGLAIQPGRGLKPALNAACVETVRLIKKKSLPMPGA